MRHALTRLIRCTSVFGALAALLLAFAGQASAQVECQPLAQGSGVEEEVAFLVDGSGSINVTDWTLERETLIRLLDDRTRVPVDGTLAVTVLQYSSEFDLVNGVQPLVKVERCLTQLNSESDVTDVKNAIAGMAQIKGGTTEGAAIEEATSVLAFLGDPDTIERRLCVMTDGIANSGPSAIEAAADAEAFGIHRLSVAAFADRAVFGSDEAEAAFADAVFGGGQLTFAANTPEYGAVLGDNCLGDPARLVAFEVNQSVQDWSDSVPLIDGKETFARIFLEPLVCPSTALQTATGRLTATRGGVQIGEPLLPTNTSTRVDFECGTAELRDEPAATLNFKLRKEWLSGDVELRLEMPGGIDCGDTTLSSTCTKTIAFDIGDFPAVTWVSLPSQVAFDPRPPIDPRPVRVPTGSELVEQRERALSMLPVADIETSYEWFKSGVIDQGQWSQDTTGNWRMNRIDTPVTQDLEWYFWKSRCNGDNDSCPTDRVHGVVNDGAGVVGKANALRGGIAVSISNLGRASARNAAGFFRHHGTHELIHNFEVPHTTNQANFGTNPNNSVLGACGSVASQSLNPEFPHNLLFPALASTTAPVDSGWRATLGPLALPIGTNAQTEVWGVDAHVYRWETFPDLAIAHPGQDWPVMSYCTGPDKTNSQLWISKPNYERVLDYVQSTDFDAPVPAGRIDGDLSFVLKGLVDVADDFIEGVEDYVDFAPAYLTPGPGPITPVPGDYSVELLDDTGAVLESAQFEPTVDEAYLPSPDDPTTAAETRPGFFLTLPAPATDVAEIVIRHGATVLGRVAASAAAPVVSISGPAANSVQGGSTVHFAWTASDADGDPLHHAVDYSHDGGTTWVPLAVDLTNSDLEIGREWLRAGASARFRVTTTDGLRSTTATSEAFEIVNNRPVVEMLSPEEDQAFYASQSIVMKAVAFDREDGALGGDAIEWISNRNGSLGFGERLEVGAHTLGSGQHLIVARAVDSEGAASADTALIDIQRVPPVHSPVPDFSMRLDPPVRTINPGDDTEFTVYVTGLNGFASSVSLSAVDLPAGWTARFSPASTAPGGSSTLRVTAPADAAETSFPIVVQGVSGDLVHTTAGTADLVFGLIPACYGHVTGIVTDAYTGLPIAGAEASPGTPKPVSDTTGFYESEPVSPGNHRVTVVAEGYYTAIFYPTPVRCDDYTHLEIELVPVLTGSAFGRVVEGEPDPDDTTAGRIVTPTDDPIEGATIVMGTARGTSDVDGHYSVDGVPLRAGTNEPAAYSALASKDGYWEQRKTVWVDRHSPLEVEFELVEKCDFFIEGGGTAFWDDGRPAVGARINWQSGFNWSAHSIVDESGRFEMPRDQVHPGINNSQVPVHIGVQDPPDEQSGGRSVRNEQVARLCGDNRLDGYEVTLIALPPPPKENMARLVGTVRDEVTGEPISRANVRAYGLNGYSISNYVTTDDFGAYDIEIQVGVDEDTSESVYIEAGTSSGYWSSRTADILAIADQTHENDVYLAPIEFISLEGAIRDVETQAPVEGVYVKVQTLRSASGSTDANGDYRVDGIYPSEGNEPNTFYVNFREQTSAAGHRYYSEIVPRFAEPGDTLIQDFDVLRQCEPAAVSGIVVNAETLEPLEDAQVRPLGPGQTDYTDADGRFRIEDIYTGTRNAPRQVEIQAAKSGFESARKTVTIFCGAEIFLEFGAPAGGFGEIFGSITDETTGEPIEGVFIGSGFGGTTTTDASGQYRLENAPLATDGSARTWQITASHGLKSQTADVTVRTGAATQQDFVFPSDPELGLSIRDEITHFDPATRNLTSLSTLAVTNTTDAPIDGPIAGRILVDRAGVEMPTADGVDASGRPVYFVLDAGASLEPGETATVELEFRRAAPLAFLYDVQLVFGDPTDGPAPAMAALGVVPPEADRDGDGWHDELDVCPTQPDPEQRDSDGDGVGDACEARQSVADMRAPVARAEWIRLTGQAPDGATRVTLGDVTIDVAADGAFEIAAPILGFSEALELVFENAEGVVATAPVEISTVEEAGR